MRLPDLAHEHPFPLLLVRLTCAPPIGSSPFCVPFHAPGTGSPFRHRCEAFHLAASPECDQETKVPHVVFAWVQASAWSEGTNERPHRRRRGDETSSGGETFLPGKIRCGGTDCQRLLWTSIPATQ